MQPNWLGLQLAVGSQHIMAWTGSVSALPGTSVPFAPKGEAEVLQAILQVFDQLSQHLSDAAETERCTFSLLSLLERSFQVHYLVASLPVGCVVD